MNKAAHSLKLFFGTFVSALLLLVGLGTLVLTFLPLFANLISTDSIDYRPLLPVAGARTSTFSHLDNLPPKQLYPPLTDAANVETGNWIRIPAIGVNVPIALSPSMQDEDIVKTLENGAALYPNGIEPGRLGNTFIAAHSTGNPWQGKYRFAFLKINELANGHEIHVDYQGTRYTYRVTTKDVVVPTPDYRVISDRPKPTLTLMACWPLWSTDKRTLISAELTNITKLTPRPS